MILARDVALGGYGSPGSMPISVVKRGLDVRRGKNFTGEVDNDAGGLSVIKLLVVGRVLEIVDVESLGDADPGVREQG